MAADVYEASTLERMRHAALALLPPGRAFSRRLSTSTVRVLEALLVELARAHAELQTVVAHLSPRRATRADYLEAWEQALELVPSGTATERAARVADKLRGRVSRTMADFRAIVAQHGYTMAEPWTTTALFRAGSGRAGDAVTNDAWSFVFGVTLTGPEAGVPALLAELNALTRAHTHLQTHIEVPPPGPTPPADGEPVYLLANLSDANYYATPVGGGEVGTATGFGGAAIVGVRHSAPSTTYRALGVYADALGWQAGMYADVNWELVAATSAPADVTLRAARIRHYDPLTLRILSWIVDVPASQLRLYLDGELVATAALASYGVPTTAPSRIGRGAAAGQGAGASLFIGSHVTFRGVPTADQMRALALAIRTAGDVPSTMTGATITHRVSLRDALGETVTSGQAGPASLPDSITSAPADAYAVTGAPVVEVVPDPYPRMRYGLGACKASSFYRTPLGSAFIPTGSWWFAVETQRKAYLDGDENVFFECSDGAALWHFRFNTFYELRVNAAGAYVTVASNSENTRYVPGLIVVSIDVEANRLAATMSHVRASQPSQNTQLSPPLVAPNPATAQMSLGANIAGGNAMAGDDAIYQVAMGLGALTLAERLEMAQAFRMTRTITPPVDKPTLHHYNLSLDIGAAGGAAPAVILDRVGDMHFERVGAEHTIAKVRETGWGLESSPILYGLSGLSLDAWYETETGLSLDTTQDFWTMLVFRPDVLLPRTAAHHALYSTGSARGFYGQIGGTWPYFQLGIYAASTRTTMISAPDTPFGRVCAVVTFTSYAGTSYTGYARNSGSAATVSNVSGVAALQAADVLMLGRGTTTSGGAYASLYGFSCGNATITLADAKVMIDNMVADDGRVQVLPGRTAHAWDFSAACAGGSVPDTITDSVGAQPLVRRGTGTPTIAQHRARLFGAFG